MHSLTLLLLPVGVNGLGLIVTCLNRPVITHFPGDISTLLPRHISAVLNRHCSTGFLGHVFTDCAGNILALLPGNIFASLMASHNFMAFLGGHRLAHFTWYSSTAFPWNILALFSFYIHAGLVGLIFTNFMLFLTNDLISNI